MTNWRNKNDKRRLCIINCITQNAKKLCHGMSNSTIEYDNMSTSENDIINDCMTNDTRK